MKHPTKTLLFFLLIFLTANSCKKDDDDNPSNDSDNFSEYFKCKINGVEFTGRSNFNCNGNSFYFYPAGAGGLDDGYMLIAGENCNENLSVFLRFFDPVVPSTGSFDITEPLCADSISPLVRHFISNDGVYKFEDEQSGTPTFDETLS